MGASSLSAWALLISMGAVPDPVVPATTTRPQPGGDLSAEDARYLDWLVADFLFDPRRATFVRIAGPGVRDVLEGRNSRFLTEGEGRDGWLVRGTNGEPDRVYFTDGESVVAPPTGLRILDFEAECESRYRARRPVGDVNTDVLIRRVLAIQYQAAESTDESHLALAAWLHRRGYDRLAARALAAARERNDEDVRDDLRAALARRAANATIRAFTDRDDVAAAAHAGRLFALYPDLAADHAPVAAVVADLHRRRRAGIGSRAPPTGPPPEFAAWDVATKVAFLIRSLDEVEHGTGSRMEFYLRTDRPTDWRVAGLLGLGEAAVPALIDAFERDGRLTRRSEREVEILTCGLGRGQRMENVLGVRDVAINLLRSILRAGDFDPTGPADAQEDDSPPALANRLRQYWARYGRLAFPDRMMAILTDPSARPAARRNAASCLTDGEDAPGPSWARGERPNSPPRPLLTRYSRPTVAEAMLAALDGERELLTRAQDQQGRFEQVESEYLGALIRLGDVRVGAELARRAAAATGPGRRLSLARAADGLGYRGPFVQLVREVATGSVRLPAAADGAVPSPVAADTAIHDLVASLSGSGPEVEDALYAIADPAHPYFPMTLRGALAEKQSQFGSGSAWLRHPLVLTVLRYALSDARPTGGHSYRRGTEVEDAVGPGRRMWSPPGGADPEKWHEHVEHRVGDTVAFRLGELVVGLPDYHPLRKDADRVRDETRALLVKYARGFRQVTWSESHQWGAWRGGDAVYVPDIKPLGRPATAADVAAGRAVFALKGSKIVAGKPPEWVTMKGTDRAAGLVVQAEVGPDGVVVYGVIFRHAIKAVRADAVEPLGERP